MRRLTGRTYVPALSLGCAIRPIVPVVSRRCGGIGCRKAIVRGCSIGRRRDACARREKRSEKPKRREDSLDCRRHDLAHPLTDASQLCANSSNQTLTPWMAARPSACTADVARISGIARSSCPQAEDYRIMAVTSGWFKICKHGQRCTSQNYCRC